MDYTPGIMPQAEDWDNGKQECGKGLHFSPSPSHTRQFLPNATKFLACPVALATMAVHPNGVYPQKIKVPGLAAPCWEVDIYGKRIAKKKTKKITKKK